MADEHDQDQKTEQPTAKKLDEAMDRGQFAKAPEIGMAFSLAAVLAVIGFTGAAGADRVTGYAVSVFSSLGKAPLRPETAVRIFTDFFLVVAPVVIPVLVACGGAALLAGGLQSGFRLTPGVLEPSFEKLDPSAGLERVFSKRGFVQAGLKSLKMVAIGLVLFVGARKLLGDPLFTSPMEVAYLGRFIEQAAVDFFGRLLFAIAAIGAVSYGYEKFRINRELMMTRQEVKDERKSSEQDAQVKGARRRLARRLLQKQMLSAVPTADVVVTNPTHYAVALKYERAKDRPPVVLAKGDNRFARRIRELAAEHGVPTVENRPVARLLFAMGRVGEAIPPELYQAVAEILALVYRTHRYYFHRLRARRLESAAA